MTICERCSSVLKDPSHFLMCKSAILFSRHFFRYTCGSHPPKGLTGGQLFFPAHMSQESPCRGLLPLDAPAAPRGSPCPPALGLEYVGSLSGEVGDTKYSVHNGVSPTKGRSNHWPPVRIGRTPHPGSPRPGGMVDMQHMNLGFLSIPFFYP